MSQSLESMILSARLKVAEDESAMIIDRNQYASRKRNRICTVTNSNDVIDTNILRQEHDNDVNVEANFWQHKYECLVSERIEAEKDFEKQLNVMDDIVQRKDSYIKLLEKKINSLEKTGNGNVNVNVDDDLKLKSRLVSFYEQMTCMSVKVKDDDKCDYSNYVCTIKNKQRRVASRFVIAVDDTSKNNVSLKYTPGANIQVLPDYLHNTIEFEAGMAPVLLGDVLNSMFEDL
jgi:hypothetical protein